MSPEITLKPEQPDDDGFLFELYSTTRAAEMALTPWNDEQRRAFLRQQYELRRLHYLSYHSGAEYLLIRRNGGPIGRIATDRREDEIRILDIALIPEHRGRGIGSQLIHELLAEASLQNNAVTLHVERHNRAAGLYQRLGFRVIEDGGVYLFLKWVPEPLTTITQYKDKSEIPCNLNCF
jgi:ribosomal protein S18 acetylase RimI-like enzyme